MKYPGILADSCTSLTLNSTQDCLLYRARLIIINGRFGFISNRRMKKKKSEGDEGGG